MKTLREIFNSLPKHCHKWDPYFDVYETWFARFRGQSPRILEIGVQHGGSGLMWEEYFGPGTRQVGVDIDSRCLRHQTDSISIEIGHQGDPAFWQQFFNKYTEPFDIVIDDGSHQMQDMILSFAIVNSHVRDSGIYLIEDCHTSYWTDPSLYGGPTQDRGLYNPNSIMEFCKIGTDVINRTHIESYPQLTQLNPQLVKVFDRVTAMHFYNSIVLFEIGQQLPFVSRRNSGEAMYQH